MSSRACDASDPHLLPSPGKNITRVSGSATSLSLSRQILSLSRLLDKDRGAASLDKDSAADKDRQAAEPELFRVPSFRAAGKQLQCSRTAEPAAAGQQSLQL